MKLLSPLSCITLLLVGISLRNPIAAQNISPANIQVLGHDFFFGADYWHQIDIALDHSNQPWVLTQFMKPNCSCNYLSNYDGVTWTTVSVPESGEMNSVFVDQNDKKWIGTSNGIYTYDGTTWVTYNTANSGLTKNNVNYVKTDNAGRVWILSSENNEIYITLWSGNSWQVFSPSETHIDGFAPGEFQLDNLNDFYFKDFNKLIKYDGNSWSVIDPSFGTKGFAVDAGNNLWYANDPSTDHLELGEWTNGSWNTTDLANAGTHEPPVWSLIADQLGRKWMIEQNEIWIYIGSDGYLLERPGDCAFSFVVRVGTDGNAWGTSTDGFGQCDVYQFLTSTTSTQDLTKTDGIEIFPNPATDVLQLRGTSSKPIHFDVKDVFGRIIYSNTVTNSSSIDISQWSSGMYFIYTSGNDQAVNGVLRFLKQ